MADLERIKSNVAKMAAQNAPEEDIDGYISSEGVSIDDIRSYSPEPTELGMFGRMGEDIMSRAGDVAEIQAMREAGMISKPAEMAMMAGKGGAGVIGDIGGELLKSGLDVAADIDKATGGYIGGGISRIGSAIGNLPSMAGGTIGEEIPKEIGQIGEAYGEFAQEHPVLSTSLESGANIAMMIPALKYGEDIIDASGAIRKGLKKSKIAKMSAEDVRKHAGDLFKLADDQGGGFTTDFNTEYLKAVRRITPQTKLGVDLKGADDPISKLINALENNVDEPFTLTGLKEADEILGNQAFKYVDNFGKMSDDGRKIMEMQTELRNLVDTAPKAMFKGGEEGFATLKEARKFWSASLRMQDVERIIQKSVGAAQPSTVIKNGFRALRDNGKRLKAYSPEEVFAIKKAAKTGNIEGFLKLTGSGLLPLIAAGSGGAAAAATGGTSLLAIPAAIAAKKAGKAGAEAIQMGKANKVSEAIRRGVMPDVPRDPLLQPLGDLSTALGRSTRPIAAMNALTQETHQNGGLSDRARALFERKNALRKGNK